MRAEATDKELEIRETEDTEDGHIAQAYFSMLWGAFSFAAMGALSHLAGERCDWQIIAIARTSVAFLLSLIIALASGVRLVLFKPRLLWMRSLVGSFGVLCAFYALTHLPVSTAITLTNTFPVWVALLAWPVLGYRPTASVSVAIFTGIVGVILIQQPYWAGSKVAILAALGNALSTAIAMIGLNRLSRVDARAVVTHFSGVSTVCCLLYFFLTGASVDYGKLSEAGLVVMLVGVGLAGTFGQLGMTRAFALGHPSKVAVVGLTQIVFGYLFDSIIWRHTPNVVTAAGVVLVAAPAAWLLLNSPIRRGASIHTSA